MINNQNNDLDKKENVLKFTPMLSLEDIEIIGGVELSENTDYRGLVAKIISAHSDDNLTENEVLEMGQEVINNYISACIQTDDILLKNYQLQEEVDNNKRFVYAINSTASDYSRKIAESIKNIELPDLRPAIEPIKRLSERLNEIVKPAGKVLAQLDSITSAIRSSWSENLKDVIDNLTLKLPDYNSVFSNISFNIQTIIKNIDSLYFSDTKKEELIEAYTQWGMLGWTIPPEGPVHLFSSAPSNDQEAYIKIKPYITDDHIYAIVRDLQTMKHVKKTDLVEAINCYKNRQYKACSMVLFSMIDARLIRSQQDSERRNGRRETGLYAAAKLFSRIETNLITETMVTTLLEHLNIIAALKTIFKGGDDFKEQPEIINRNFVDHGMLHRKVTKKECKMLFLLLYNFTQHLNYLSDSKPSLEGNR